MRRLALVFLVACAVDEPALSDTESALTVGSCSGYCGRRWPATHGLCSRTDFPGAGFWCEQTATRNDGCSCEATCGLFGTCCADAKDYCDAIDGEVDWWDPSTPMMNGDRFVEIVGPEYIASSKQYGRKTRYLTPYTWPAHTAVAGLTRVKLSELDDGGEHAMCEIAIEHPVGESMEFWTLAAATYNFSRSGDSAAACDGMALRFPSGMMTVSPQEDVNASGGTNIFTTGYSTWQWFPVLTRTWLEDVDGDREDVWCQVYEGAGGSWQISARADDDSDARCGVRFLNLNYSNVTAVTSCPADLTRSPPANDTHHNTGCASGYFTASAIEGSRTESTVSLMPQAGYACFLQKVHFEEADNGDEPGDCELYIHDGRWYLAARSHDDQESYCAARCLDLGTTTYNWYSGINWPPKPNVKVTAPFGMTGMEMELYQSGSYDMPVVMLEGIDTTNNSSPAYHVRNQALMLQRALLWGLDVWVVDFADGGQALLTSARQAAAAVDVAYHQQSFNTTYPSREIVVTGLSMGGLAGRIMLASWEEGRYTDPASPEYISTALGRGVPPGGARANALTHYIAPYDPPVSLYASINGPHQGANIPVSLQVLVQDVSGVFDLGEATAMLNSPAAINMLEERVDNRCRGVITEDCDALLGFYSKMVTKNGSFVLDENSCPAARNTGCTKWHYHLLNGWECIGTTETVSDAFYDDVNVRGLPGAHGVFSGFPRSVVTYGISNGSWSNQSCSAQPPYETCTWPTMGGHPILGNASITTQTFNDICERSTSVNLLLDFGADLRPGDLGIRTMDQLFLGALPKAVVGFHVNQNYAPLFIPTRSALNCIAGVSDANCMFWNREHDGFNRIRSNAGYNGFHSTVAPELGLSFLTFIFDGYTDADGYPGSANALYYSTGLAPGDPVDCDDYDRAKFPGNPEVCGDGKDNDCNGRIDNRNVICSCGSWKCPDMTGDRRVDLNDVNAMSSHAGTNDTQGTSAYDPRFDVDCNGYVDAVDQYRVQQMIGAQCQVGNPACATTDYVCCDGSDDDCDGVIDDGCSCGGGGGGGGGCLLAGTRVTMADGSEKNIEDIRVNDLNRIVRPEIHGA